METNPESKSDSQKARKVVVRSHDFGDTKPGVDLNRLNQLADELSVEDYLRKAAKDEAGGNKPTE